MSTLSLELMGVGKAVSFKVLNDLFKVLLLFLKFSCSGLVLGLLADSKHTKRYTKLQDFIQRGTDKAKIIITLKNQGEDAYKPEAYVSSISF